MEDIIRYDLKNAYLVQVLQIHCVPDHGVNYVREFGSIS
jgi:hypothetical protein